MAQAMAVFVHVDILQRLFPADLYIFAEAKVAALDERYTFPL